MSQQDNKEMAKHFYRASAADFKKIPGSPITYWMKSNIRDFFTKYELLKNIAEPRPGLSSTNNGKFLRQWYECNLNNMCFEASSSSEAKLSGARWFPFNKGGDARKWYGNREFVVNWFNDGQDIKRAAEGASGGRVVSEEYYFLESVSASAIASDENSYRYYPPGALFDVNFRSYFSTKGITFFGLIGFLNSKVSRMMLGFISSTVALNKVDLERLPFVPVGDAAEIYVSKLISLSKQDWNSNEFSWGFLSIQLLNDEHCKSVIKKNYQKLRTNWLETTLEMQRLEEENNRLFIEAYGLQDELTPDVPLAEITLTCNPHYRYGGNLSDEEREARLQSDTIAELVSYAIGCMMGRYSLDREGLVYAHAGNVGFNDLVAEGAYQRFAADGDGILPLTSEHWFEDDIAARIEEFVRTVWGADTLEENLQFIADSLCLSAIKPPKKGGETSRETIRRYLSTQFFKDHLKTYKKRPIYWLFSSGKEKAFECLVYLHRYNEATLPRMRTEYVTPLLGQMASRIERLRLQKADASTAEAKRLDKQIDGLTKQLAELRAFDDQLKHHADMKITLDLDDGVKVNYGKFGTLLSDVKAITGDKGE